MPWEYDFPYSENKIIKNVWAAAWNKNLENYNDCFKRSGGKTCNLHRLNRLNRMVYDLKIEEGIVKAVIVGSRTNPNDTYDVKIIVQKMPKDNWDNIVSELGLKISNFKELASGKFSRDFSEKLLNQKIGLFPSL